ncbi:hypothetical protein PAF17_13350 [Paracoccus sp. Z330]|uniref:Uncharacterized protein n=1 Tax=Paracoccus onchidii TaxID=3017813 RepID=A0ABT4ZGJ1_9RHOB|nr:hypothetical protein [Paracoccus onchidii]MDB6178483.1 hypothetical protein [Paracoccus onchidii]
MKLFATAAVLAATALAACAPTEPAVEVSVTDWSAEDLNAATGMPGEAIIAASKAENRVIVFYRDDAVTEEQVAAAPAQICSNLESDVFSTDGVDPTTPEFADGVKKLTVTCGG